jgi:glyoxylase-like metal-dependent hydrolase (beta-lactamase superfamily II)
MLTGVGGLLEEARMICYCLLIEGADGLVLLDTGFGLDDIRNPRQLGRPFTAIVRPRLNVADAAITQIRALGFDPHDVRNIITTHLDLDHAGGLPDFPDAEVHLLGAELEAALHPSWRDRPRYVAAHWAHGPRWVTHGAGGDSWHGFDSVRILGDRRLRRLRSGRRPARIGNVERLRELALRHSDEVRLICSHDASYLQEPAVSRSAALG